MTIIEKIKGFFAKYSNANAMKKTRYVGCLSTSTFHRPNCKYVKKMVDIDNRVFYDFSTTYSQLTKLGMKPCSHCKPK